MYNDPFNTPFFRGEKESSWKFWKYPVIIIGVSLVFVVLFAIIIASAQNKPNTKKLQLYQIEVNTFGASTIYLTTEYKIDSVTRCIRFKDGIGIKKQVCDHYTVTTYLE